MRSDVRRKRVARVTINVNQHANALAAVIELRDRAVGNVQIGVGHKRWRLGQGKRGVVVGAGDRKRTGIGAQVKRIAHVGGIKVGGKILSASGCGAHLGQKA